MKHITDQLNREVILENIPRRIISLVPSITELLIDLGLEDYLVGITKFCVHPEHLREEKKIVGGTKKINPDTIRALSPDIILCNKEENTPEMVLQLEKIATVHVSDIVNIDDTLELIRQYGEIFEVEARAAKLNAEISSALATFKTFMEDKPKRRVAYFIWKNPWMVAGGDTFVDHLLELNNFTNAYQKEGARYPTIKLRSLEEKEVELVLLSSEPYPFAAVHKTEIRNFQENGEIKIVDGEYFSWYGTRLLSAFSYFTSLQNSLL